MFLEIAGSIVAGGIVAYSTYQKSGGMNDASKIQRICTANGLIHNGETMHLLRRTRHKWGMEYVYRIPLKFSSKDYEAKKDNIQDGLNNKRSVLDITIEDLKRLKLSRNIIEDIKALLNKKKHLRKEIELSYDGTLRIKVFDEPMKDKIPWAESMLKKSSWSVVVGYDREEKAIYHDFDKSKHLLIAGATGYGKSVALKLIVTSLILQKANDLELSLIDLKGGSAFHRFKDCKQVVNYGRNPEDAEVILKDVQERMEKDFTEVVDQGFEDVKEAGIKKRHFIVIDESADMADNQAAMDIVTDIARRGRSAGYYLIFCTQYPTAEVIPSQTKRNIIARLSYVLDTSTASTVVLDESGAESLPDIPGRGIYKCLRKTTIQTPFIENAVIQERIQPHINIRPRKESVEANGKVSEERAERRKYTPVFEETELP